MPTAYRDPPTPREEILETYAVSTFKGGEVVGLLGALSLVFLVALVVSLVAGAPPEIEPWVWTFPVAAGVIAIPTAYLWQRRRRTLTIVRVGEAVHLGASGGVRLAFPLAMSGNQITIHMRGVPMHHVHLKLVDAKGNAIFLREVRGAIHGPAADWLDAIATGGQAEAYEVGLGDAEKIRRRVEALNREVAPA